MESPLRAKRGLRAKRPKVERLENCSSQTFREILFHSNWAAFPFTGFPMQLAMAPREGSLWPAADGELTSFLRWLTLTHSVRWHKHHHSTGSGHVCRNRFKAFAVAEDDHLLRVLRYVERNPLRAGLARRAEDWPWSSLACRLAGGEVALRRLHPCQSHCPLTGSGGEQGADRSRIGGHAPTGGTRPSLRLGRLGGRGGKATGLAVDDPATWPAAETKDWGGRGVINRCVPFIHLNK
jgi:hypothetical protein